MGNDRKEEIILATLELAAEKGLRGISTNMIADKVGIRKPSLYNHFKSKDEIVQSMYQYIRDKAKESSKISIIDYEAMFEGKTALEILQTAANNYRMINKDEKMRMFYKVIYSERVLEPTAAKIMTEETEKMILATKQLFYALQIHNLLFFKNPDMSAVTFAMTIHGLMDYDEDIAFAKDRIDINKKKNLLEDYLKWFCDANKVKESGMK